MFMNGVSGDSGELYRENEVRLHVDVSGSSAELFYGHGTHLRVDVFRSYRDVLPLDVGYVA